MKERCEWKLEKPIIFSTLMVKAIFDGRKTQTRRVINQDISNRFDIDTDGTAFAYNDQATGDSYRPQDICRYKPGDILWVRETWLPTEPYFGKGTEPKYYYRANQSPESEQCRKDFGIPWRTSIYMPREAARIFLKVKSVRVERLQDITEEDAIAEGCVPEPMGRCGYHESCLDCDSYPYNSFGAGKGTITNDDNCCMLAKDKYTELWNALNAKRGNRWDSNPWVWVIGFERVYITRERAKGEEKWL